MRSPQSDRAPARTARTLPDALGQATEPEMDGDGDGDRDRNRDRESLCQRQQIDASPQISRGAGDADAERDAERDAE